MSNWIKSPSTTTIQANILLFAPADNATENRFHARLLGEYPQVVAAAARELAPHYIAFYLRELCAGFHSYYNAVPFLVDDEPTKQARLALIAAVRQALANGLALLGVSAPERM